MVEEDAHYMSAVEQEVSSTAEVREAAATEEERTHGARDAMSPLRKQNLADQQLKARSCT